MEIGSDSYEDWNIKYSKVIGVTKDDLVHIDLMDEDNYISFYKANNGVWEPSREHMSKIDIDFTIPEMGCINHKQGVVLVGRTTSKSYKSGFTFKQGAYECRFLLKERASDIYAASAVKDASCAQDIFSPHFFTPENAISLILDKQVLSAAVTNRYYFSVSDRLPYVYLGYKDYVIGRVNSKGGCTLFKCAEPLLEDIQQYIKIL